MDPKSISLKQHRVKASQTLHTWSYCHPATPPHLQSTGTALTWAKTTQGSAADGARGRGWTGGQVGSQVTTERLWSTGEPCELGSVCTWLGPGAQSIRPTQGSSKPGAKPTGQ